MGSHVLLCRLARGRVATRSTSYHRRGAAPANPSGGVWRWFGVAEDGVATGWVFLPPSVTGELERWLAPGRAAAIARIVEAVGIAPDDEIRLATDIHQAYCEHPNYGEAPIGLVVLGASEARVRLKTVRSILAAGEKLRELIDADRYISATINELDTPFHIPIVQQLLLKLRSLEKVLEGLAKKWRTKADLPENLKGRRPSRREWLAGVSLPLVFERHFVRRAVLSRNSDGKPSGPCVKFIGATLEELGLSYEPEFDHPRFYSFEASA